MAGGRGSGASAEAGGAPAGSGGAYAVLGSGGSRPAPGAVALGGSMPSSVYLLAHERSAVEALRARGLRRSVGCEPRVGRARTG